MRDCILCWKERQYKRLKFLEAWYSVYEIQYRICWCGSTKEKLESLVNEYDEAQQKIEYIDVFRDTDALKEQTDKQQDLLKSINRLWKTVKIDS